MSMMLSFLNVYAFFGIIALAFGSVSEQDLFPFGLDNDDSLLPADDDGFAGPIKLQNKFPFSYNNYNHLFVDNNGVISFDQGVTAFTPTCKGLQSQQGLIFPYWADIDTSQGLGGAVYYRESNDSALIKKAAKEIQTAYPKLLSLQINSVFIATWYQAPFSGALACGYTNETAPRNTFQAILAANKYSSYVIFYYASITWTTGRNSGGDCDGLGGSPARAGYDTGNGYDYYNIRHSCNDGILNITETSNYNSPGKWVLNLQDDSYSKGNRNVAPGGRKVQKLAGKLQAK